jgi:transglutaminase-like putative cysteine protease
MLFTTLARALSIPAREVSGLAYMGDEVRAFGGHAWCEVVLEGRWVPVDPTWGETSLSATHIRLSTQKNHDGIDVLGAVTLTLVSVNGKRVEKKGGDRPGGKSGTGGK